MIASLICVLALSSTDMKPTTGAAVVSTNRGSSTGVVVLAAGAERIFDTIARPTHWPSVFSDAVKVEGGTKGDASRWRVQSRLMGHAHVLDLATTRPTLIHFHIVDGGPGGSLSVDIRLKALSPTSTRISYAMATVLPLGLGAVVDDDMVRRHREEKILTDLRDLERVFGSPPKETP